MFYPAAMARPYPSELVHDALLRDGTRITVRPIRPTDREIERAFVRNLSSESKYFRFMSALGELPESMLSRFIDIDYDREMALIAVVCEGGTETEIAVARYVVNPEDTGCEFALVVADAWQRRGIGSLILLDLIIAASARGLQFMEGLVLASNSGMLGLVASLGFAIHSRAGDPTVRLVTKPLQNGQVLPQKAMAPHVN